MINEISLHLARFFVVVLRSEGRWEKHSVAACETVIGMDADVEPTGMYSRRVSQAPTERCHLSLLKIGLWTHWVEVSDHLHVE